MVWDECVATTERCPPGEYLEACSGIFGGQRSVVAIVWEERVATTERCFLVVMSPVARNPAGECLGACSGVLYCEANCILLLNVVDSWFRL